LSLRSRSPCPSVFPGGASTNHPIMSADLPHTALVCRPVGVPENRQKVPVFALRPVPRPINTGVMERRGGAGRVPISLNRLLTLFVLVALVVVFSLVARSFFTVGSILNLLVQTSTFTIAAIGSCLVLIVGGVDFSLGAVVALSGTAVAVLASLQTPIWIAMIAASFLGGIVGMANGFLVARFRLPSFLTTLGTAMIVYGLLGFAAGHSRPMTVPESLGDLANRPLFRTFSPGPGGGRTTAFPGVSWVIIFMVIVAVLFHFITRKTRIGRSAYLVGSNPVAARFSGIKVQRVTTTVFALSGLLAGLAGVLLASRMVGPPGGAAGYETIGIACAMIGGASLSGGAGSIGGTVIGSFIISTLAMGLSMLNTSNPALPQLFNGVIVLVAVSLDQVRYARLPNSRSSG
jgi:ribose transport system permease protein